MRSYHAPYLLTVVVLLFSVGSLRADSKWVFKDADKINQIYYSLGGPEWNRQEGWPIPTGELTSWPSKMPDHCWFVTVYRTEGQTSYTEFYLKRLSINRLGAKGQLPATISFDSLEVFEVIGDTLVTGAFPTFNCPKIKEIWFGANGMTGEIPNYSYPTLERLSLTDLKTTSAVPPLNCPNLISYRINSNDFMRGPLGKLTAPKLKELEITFLDSLRGELFPLDFPEIEEINIRYNPFLTGTISRLTFEGATYCTIDNCAISGVLPEVNMPLCAYFNLSENELTGSIPTLILPLAREVRLNANRLDGTMSAQSLPTCKEFDVSGNALTGDLPLLSLPKCTTVSVRKNKFTGTVTNLDLPVLVHLQASYNEFTGTLPTAWTSPDIKGIYLDYNKLTGPLPAWQLPALEFLGVERNKLSGVLANASYPALRTFRITANKFTGAFPVLTCPELFGISADSNRLTDLPDLKATSPKLTSLNMQANKLTFGPMERNVSLGVNSFLRQDSVELFSEQLKDKRTMFYVKVDGSANTYTWIRINENGNEQWLSDIDNDTLIVNAGEARLHYCKISNNIVSGVTLYSRKHQSAGGIANPWVFKNLSFFAEGADGWEVDESDPVISTSGTVTINELLAFEGTIKIDTEQVSIDAEGTFSLKNVPLPGGGVGTFIVSQGKYGLKLLGEDGAITDFANDALSKIPEVAGIKIAISNIKLVGGRQATGISISGSIEIEGLAGGCSDGEPGPTKLELEDLAYSRTEGPSLGGMKLEDLGFVSFPKFCVKELQAKYERDKNKLSFGAKVAMPFAEIGGGVAMIGDEVDSIAWRIEATEHAVPIGQTNMGMSGFFGSISGIQSKPLDVELGGVFITMVPKDFVKFDASGTFTAPATFGLKLDGTAIPTPGDDDVYQLKLKGSTKYDFAEGMAKLEGEANLGTTDGEEYFLDGSLKVDFKASSLALKGSLAGGYQISAFGEEDADEYPYDWINAKLGLPKKVSTEANFAFIKSRVMYGVAHLGKDMGDIRYVFDFRKSWRDPDFLFWERTPAAEELHGGSVEIATTRTVIVPDNATRMVVRVKGASTLPTSTLTLPNGTTVTGTDASKKIDYASVTGKAKAFWTVLEPTAGRWTINAPSAATGDVIEIFVDALPAPFTFAHTQQGRNVTLTWTPQGNVDDSIAFFVAGTGTTADGLDLGAASLTAGSKMITIPMNLPVCTFNIEAQGTRGMDVVSDTSTTPITVQTGSVTAPSMMLAKYYSGQKLLNITWTPSAVNDKNVKSYVIYARNAAGEERLLGEAFRWVGWVSVPYTRQSGDKVTVRGVDASGRMGCPTEITQITTDITEASNDEQASITIIPHPVNGSSTVHFVNGTAGTALITVCDMQGRTVMTLHDGYLDAGPASIGLAGTNMSSGVYIVVVRTPSGTEQVPMVVAH